MIDANNIAFNSYIISSNKLNLNSFWLLDVDYQILINSQILILITAADVLYLWNIPSRIQVIKSIWIPGHI